MNAQPATHPAAEQLSAFGLGKLNDAAATAIAQHLEGCLSCRKAVEKVAGDTFLGLVRAAKAPASAAPSSPTPLPKDRKLGAPQTPATPPPGLPPELAGHAKYRIVRELGRGGMGVVYQAEHIQMERLVAIKVINKSILEHPQALERFAQEVRAAAKLSHPNIVAAYDFEQAGDLHMLVMEFVEGQNLAEIVERKGPLPLLNACHYVRQAALGLQHAFEKGMVHRDLKPQNLMLMPKGTVKLLDMGLARVASDKEGLTGTGATLGTPEYIAPEQAMDSAKADIRSDIYSLGCTLYCLLGGRPPFADGTAMQKILGHLEKEPPPLQGLRPEVPEKLAAVVARMMAKDPEKRYQKPVEVAQALAPFGRPGAKGVAAEPAPAAKPAAPAPPRPATPTMAAGSSAVRWDTLTDGDAAGKVVSAKKKTQKVQSRPAGLAAKKKWLIGGAAAAVALLTLLVLIGLVGLWAGVFRVMTKDGSTIVLENLPPDAEVLVDGGKVTVTSSDGKTFEVRVDPGKKHRLEVKKEGFKVFGEEVEVDTGGRKPVLVRLVPKEKPEKELPKTMTVDLGGGVKMEFVLIPKGKSWLGGGGGKPGDKEVEFRDDFYLGVYKVTQEEWQKFMGNNPSCFFRGGKNQDAVKDIGNLDLKRFPVENVTWNDAQKFLTALNAREQEPGWMYRLPKEAEWEYACRGGPMNDKAASAFDFYLDEPTNQLLPAQANFKHGMSLKRPCKVGSYLPNRLGLYDMHGNVIEWCDDEWAGTGHSYRGGCWSDSAERCRAGFRFGNGSPAAHDNYLGLRVARVPVGKENKAPASLGPDRKAVAYVLSNGGTVRVIEQESGRESQIGAVADLPRESFRLTWVGLRENKRVSDAGLASFKDCDCTNLTCLDLGGTQVSDVGLANFKDCKNLTILWLYGAKVGDTSLANFKDSKNLTELYLHGTQVSDAGLANFKDCKNLRRLTLGGTQVGDVGLAYLKECKNLTLLDVGNTQVSNAGLAYFKDCKNLTELLLYGAQVSDAGLANFKDCKNLTHLDLRKTKVTADGIEDLKKALPKCGIDWDGVIQPSASLDPDRKAAEYVLSIGGAVRVNDEVDDIKVATDLPREAFRLTYVDLWGNPKVRNAGLAAFNGCKHLTVLRINETLVKDQGLTYFKDCKNLEILYLHGTEISDEGLANFKDCKKLQVLFLNHTKVTGVGLVHFSGCKNLKELSLFAVKIDDAGLAHILKDSLNLENLNLGGTNVTDATLAHLQNNKNLSALYLSGLVTDKGMVYLKDCTNLTRLGLEGAQVTDKGMVYLKDCTNLTSLNLSHTAVGDEGLANFKNCKKLRDLALHNTQMSDKGLAYFTGCDKLERLSQRGSKVTKAGLDDFRKLFPRCNIDIQPDQK